MATAFLVLTRMGHRKELRWRVPPCLFFSPYAEMPSLLQYLVRCTSVTLSHVPCLKSVTLTVRYILAIQKISGGLALAIASLSLTNSQEKIIRWGFKLFANGEYLILMCVVAFVCRVFGFFLAAEIGCGRNYFGEWKLGRLQIVRSGGIGMALVFQPKNHGLESKV